MKTILYDSIENQKAFKRMRLKNHVLHKRIRN